MYFTTLMDEEREKREVKRAPPNQRKLTVAQHVTKGWVPVSPRALEQARAACIEKNSTGKDSLITSVKNDPGLFLWCARSLHRITPPAHGTINPLTLLKDTPLTELQPLFAKNSAEMSSLDITSSTRGQSQLAKHTVLSAHVAEELAHTLNINGDNAFVSAQLRQSGLALIAWNYPRIFSQCLNKSKRSGSSLDAELTTLLGISPLELMREVSESWDLSPNLRGTTTLAGGAFLQELTTVADLYAKTQDPETYPNAAGEWKQKQAKIYESFPPEVFTSLTEKIPDIIEAFNQIHPSTHGLASPRVHTSPEKSSSLLSVLKNPSITKCSLDAQKIFTNVYDKMTPGALSLEAVKEISEGATTSLGFLRGCLYLLKEKTHTLSPLIRLGDATLELFYYPEHSPLPYLQATPYSWILYQGINPGVRDTTVYQLSSGLDSTKYFGIFYLETQVDEEGIPQEMVHRFHALRRAMVQALGEV